MIPRWHLGMHSVLELAQPSWLIQELAPVATSTAMVPLPAQTAPLALWAPATPLQAAMLGAFYSKITVYQRQQ
jgi:hypothetical protein